MCYKDFQVNNDTLRLFFQKKLLNNLQLYLYSLLLPLEHDYYIHYSTSPLAKLEF